MAATFAANAAAIVPAEGPSHQGESRHRTSDERRRQHLQRAEEGFLPGYGLDVGAVVGWAEIPFSLPRPPAVALREYMPGNLIYANGHRFVARRFHRELRDERAEMPYYEVSAERQAVCPSTHGEGSLLGGHVLCAIAVCDADLVHASHISDKSGSAPTITAIWTAPSPPSACRSGGRLTLEHDIPPRESTAASLENSMPANEAEARLRRMLLAAGFGECARGKRIRLNSALGSTTPDVFYCAEDHEPDEGVCIYLDGLSRHIHGNPETAERDRQICAWLRGSGYEVLEIAASELGDEQAMAKHFRRLAGYLGHVSRSGSALHGTSASTSACSSPRSLARREPDGLQPLQRQLNGDLPPRMVLAYQVPIGIVQIGNQVSDFLHQLLLRLGFCHQSGKVRIGDVPDASFIVPRDRGEIRG